jgi:hypothetical protein
MNWWQVLCVALTAFCVGFTLAVNLARSEMEHLADKLTETRNRLFDCNRRLNESERNLHGRRG